MPSKAWLNKALAVIVRVILLKLMRSITTIEARAIVFRSLCFTVVQAISFVPRSIAACTVRVESTVSGLIRVATVRVGAIGSFLVGTATVGTESGIRAVRL